MTKNTEKGVDLSLRQFIKSLGYIAGGTALLSTTPVSYTHLTLPTIA